MRYRPSHAIAPRTPPLRVIRVAALSMLALGASDAHGQVPLEAGERVRLWLAGDAPAVQGTLSSMEGDALDVVESDGTARRVSTEDVSFAEVAVSRGNTLRGAAIGGGVGLIGGLLVVATSDDACDRDVDPLCDLVVGTVNTVALLWGPVGGALLGALVGTAVRSDHWVPAVLPRRGAVSVVWRASR